MQEHVYIHPSLRDLAIEIDLLDPLNGNPRIGDVEAIAASLNQFGQVKPIVVHPTKDGRYTVLAGNHTMEAALSLGWTHIACVVGKEMDESDAVAFALMDNRVSELGYTDEELLTDFIVDVIDVFPDMFEVVGWDDFEIAAMTPTKGVVYDEGETRRGFTPPVLISNPGADTPAPLAGPSITPVTVADASSDSGTRLVAPEGTDQRAAVIGGVGGATSQNAATAKKALMQYTLIFDDAAQMGRWWDFVRFLRSSPVYGGDTIAERLMNFVEAHGNF
jgi:hypothetical protein